MGALSLEEETVSLKKKADLVLASMWSLKVMQLVRVVLFLLEVFSLLPWLSLQVDLFSLLLSGYNCACREIVTKLCKLKTVCICEDYEMCSNCSVCVRKELGKMEA